MSPVQTFVVSEPAFSAQVLRQFEALAVTVQRADGVAAFSEQAHVEVGKAATGQDAGARLFEVTAGGATVGFAALIREGATWVLEAAIDPGARGQGAGRVLVESAAAHVPADSLRAWVHSGSDAQAPHTLAAQALAKHLGWEPVRELYKLGLPLTGQGRQSVLAQATQHPLPAGLSLTTFTEADGPAWVAVNAAAFAHHPEQGRLTENDLAARVRTDWFRAEGFLLAKDATGQVAGFHWTKIPTDQGETVTGASPEGEVYAVGIAPTWQGQGLGRSLTLAGMAYLAQARDGQDRPLERIVLYVDAENTAAFSLYRSLGFTPVTVDRQYTPSNLSSAHA
ncbi:mycothiol synthase [Rothia nasimurium]|uniref:Mycothiol acetyltransferase n=1 Tax=Rothia nasimurium TaxID=85336 RepID=A0A1Y1RRY0_9MICC|nr:mycothiol synthase [Rothia nasimurium]